MQRAGCASVEVRKSSWWGIDTEEERWGSRASGNSRQEIGTSLQVGRNVGVGLPNSDSVPQALTWLKSSEYEVVVEARGKPTGKKKDLTLGGGALRPRKVLPAIGGRV